jgi:hypothetical protein
VSTSPQRVAFRAHGLYTGPRVRGVDLLRPAAAVGCTAGHGMQVQQVNVSVVVAIVAAIGWWSPPHLAPVALRDKLGQWGRAVHGNHDGLSRLRDVQDGVEALVEELVEVAVVAGWIPGSHPRWCELQVPHKCGRVR